MCGGKPSTPEATFIFQSLGLLSVCVLRPGCKLIAGKERKVLGDESSNPTSPTRQRARVLRALLDGDKRLLENHTSKDRLGK